MHSVSRSRIALLSTLTVAGILACGGEGAGVSRDAGRITAVMDTSDGLPKASVMVLGLSSAELKVASELSGDSAWHTVLRVAVAGSENTAVIGAYSVNDSAIVFTPRYSFDGGRPYNVSVNARVLSPARGDSVALLTVALPVGNVQASTRVLRILPGGRVLPENLLRLYVEFSAPMSRTGGLEFMKLVDDKGDEIPAAFLPLDADFWNAERTRYTAFLDPGRVKRGILPNEQMGRAFIPGRKYAFVVDSAWRDERGVPLVAGFRREFVAGAAEERPIEYAKWKLSSPRLGSRDALVVSFEKPLDHGLLRRALGVQTKAGAQTTGVTSIERDETEWRFVPDLPWAAGDYSLVILSIIEDAAGNRVDGPFEVDVFNQIDKAGKQEQYSRPFRIGN